MATLTQMMEQHAELGEKIEAARTELRAHAAAQIKALMAEFQVTVSDLADGTITVTTKAAKATKKAPAKKATAKAAKPAKAPKAEAAPKANGKGSNQSKGTKPPKYQHPETGATWSGMGHTPGWMKDVKDRDQYLIAAE